VRRRLPLLLALVVGAAVGYVAAGSRPTAAPAPIASARREALVFAPKEGGGQVRHALRVKRVVAPETGPTDFEPVALNTRGELVIEPGEWVVTVDGRTYLLAPAQP
jgi:hypothetical protein